MASEYDPKTEPDEVRAPALTHMRTTRWMHYLLYFLLLLGVRLLLLLLYLFLKGAKAAV